MRDSGIPRFAGVCTLGEAQRAGFSVAEAVRRLRRLAYVKQRLALAAAAHLNSSPEWEVKSALALHAWIDGEHASALRARCMELREPAPRLDEAPDAALAVLMDEVAAARDTVELLTAVYQVVRPALLKSVERYLAETNPLADQPTSRVLKLLAIEEREAIAWGRAALDALSGAGLPASYAGTPGRMPGVTAKGAPNPALQGSKSWAAQLDEFLAATGGVDGTQLRNAAKLPKRRSAKPLQPDVTPRRDARFSGLYDTSTPADVVYLDDSRPLDERNLALQFKRVREMDVPEVVAGILAQTPGRPWEYYAEMLRQMWDEARHALLGEAALSRYASKGAANSAPTLDWTKLPINVTFSHKLAAHCSPVERHILLYAIEQSLMPARRGKKYEWEIAREAGDELGTTFQDFDWADEVLHVAIARRNLRPALQGGLSEARRRADRLWKRIEKGLERQPLPADATPRDWWEEFAAAALGRRTAPVPQTHVKDWRPLSG